MKKLKQILILAFVILLVVGVTKNALWDTPQRCLRKVSGLQEQLRTNRAQTNVFDKDKRLIYRIYYFAVVPMGRLTFQTQAIDTETRCSIEATSKDSIAQVFVQARAGLQSILDKKNRQTLKYSERTSINGKIKTKEILFDQANHLAMREGVQIRIPENTYDPLGAFLTMLALPLDFGVEKTILFLTKEVIYAMRSKVIRAQGGIAELLVDAHRLDRSSNHGTAFRVWLTDDSLRIPLLFKSWTPVGFVSVILERAEVESYG